MICCTSAASDVAWDVHIMPVDMRWDASPLDLTRFPCSRIGRGEDAERPRQINVPRPRPGHVRERDPVANNSRTRFGRERDPVANRPRTRFVREREPFTIAHYSWHWACPQPVRVRNQSVTTTAVCPCPRTVRRRVQSETAKLSQLVGGLFPNRSVTGTSPRPEHGLFALPRAYEGHVGNACLSAGSAGAPARCWR